MTSLMHQELHEQPSILARQLTGSQQAVADLADLVRERSPEYVLLTARGSSDNAARYAKYLFGIHNGLSVALAAPSILTRYGRATGMSSALVMGISQSGASPDIVAVVREATEQGALTGAVTVYPESDLGRAASAVIPLLTGEERAVAATKTYTAELLALAMLSCAIDKSDQYARELQQVPELVERVLHVPDSVYERVAEYLLQARTVAVVGRGFNYGTAMEIALKIQETSYLVAHPFSSADFRHGPLALVEPGFPAVFVDVQGAVRDDLRALARTVRQQGGRVLWITDDESVASDDDPRQLALRIPSAPEWLSPLVAVVAGQRLALAIALARGLDPDSPRALHKVTETR